MKVKIDNIKFRSFLIVILLCLPVSIIFAQNKTKDKLSEFCTRTDLFNGGSGVTIRELREMPLPVRSLVTVDVKRHGSISIRGGDCSDILVRSCVQAWGISDEAAHALASNIGIKEGSAIRAESGAANENIWSVSAVSYEIFVPRRTNLNLSTWNGNISISNVEGNLQFIALNGNLNLENLAGDVRGKTTNGNVGVKLSGNSWIGMGLDVETTNGNVGLIVPQNYAASLETGTAMGELIGSINPDMKKKVRPGGRQILTKLNSGGVPIRLKTTVGNISVNSR
jgi:hypothetical protein